MRIWIAGGIGALLFGCGPIQSTSLIVDAQAELAAARTVEAENHAPFELTAAEVYLAKAKEEQGYAEFEVASKFAQKALDCARVARMQGETATKETLGTVRPTHSTQAQCKAGPDRIGPPPVEDPKIRQAAAKARRDAQPSNAPPPIPIAPTDPPAQNETADPPPVAPPPAEPLPEGDASEADAVETADAPEEAQR